MNKQIEEIKAVLVRTHKRARTGQEDYMQDRYAEALYTKGYRKSTDVAREIFEEIDDALQKMATEYADAGHPTYYAVCEMVHHKVMRPIEKKYESEGADYE